MSLRPSTKTFGGLLQDVRRTFGDEAGVQLDSSDIQRWANVAQQEIVTSNKAIKAKSTLSSAIGTNTYTFPSVKIQQVEALHYDNVMLENLPFAEAERVVLSQDPTQTETGTPVLWYEWAGTFTLWPTPDDVKDITLYFTAYPDDLTGDPAQFLSVPDKFYNAVVDFIMSKAYEMDEDMQASQLAEQRFRSSLESQMEDERQASHMTYPVILETWSY